MATFLAGLLPRIVRTGSKILSRAKGAYAAIANSRIPTPLQVVRSVARDIVKRTTPPPLVLKTSTPEEKLEKSKAAMERYNQRIAAKVAKSKEAADRYNQRIAEKVERGERGRASLTRLMQKNVKKAEKAPRQENQQLLARARKLRYLAERAKK
jgi:hypothetical protein